MPQATPQTQKERVAALYLTKRQNLARASAERMGRPHGMQDASWAQIVKAWNMPSDTVTEEQAWEQALAFGAKAIADDPALDQAKVAVEVACKAGMARFPNREKILRDGGGTTYKEWADYADEIEKRAAVDRQQNPPPADQAASGPEAPPPEPAAPPVPESMAPPPTAPIPAPAMVGGAP